MWDNYQLLRAMANFMLVSSVLILLYTAGFWVTHAPLFPVRTIQIQGDMKRLTPEQLKFIAEHQLSGTFFTLDIDKTRAAFSKLPWVRDAQVRRRWPDTLDIQVEEHMPLARWGENGLINTHGERFDAASDQELPVFYGPAGAEKDMSIMYGHFKQDLSPIGLMPKELWLSSRRAWKVVLDNKVQVELGRNDINQRANRFAQYWKQELVTLPYRVEYVDMRYPNGFAVRMPDYRAAAVTANKH
ncbi:cell division protein FtsQ/DivIB [Neisseriaceae bacterium TC5R-5]|nr:cell division protein FtsQ/DivIB [Neisseriaceae bacterium TC5R-5]